MNGVLVTLPFHLPDNSLSIHVSGSFVTMHTDSGLYINHNGLWNMEIRLPEEYNEQVYGMYA